LESSALNPEGTIHKHLAETANAVLAACLARIRENRPDLASVMEAWDGLSEAVKAGILAMVEASGRDGADPGEKAL